MSGGFFGRLRSLLEVRREKLPHGFEGDKSGLTGRKPVVFALQLDQLHAPSGSAETALHETALRDIHDGVILAVNQQNRGLEPSGEIRRRHILQILAFLL